MNPIARNSAALTLSDRGDVGCVPIIVDLLQDPKTLGFRGTLLYALEPFDCRELLELLVELVITGGFEVRHQALQNIAQIEGVIALDVWELCSERIQQALQDASEDRRALLLELEALFAG